MHAESTTYNVVTSRILDATSAQAWQAWSEPEKVKQWWGPGLFTVPLAEMDFREGGTSLICMRAPAEFGGQDMFNTWTYTRIIPHERIEFVHRFTVEDGTPLDPAQMGMPPGVPPEVPHVITFRPLDHNRTEMTVTEYGFTRQEARDMSLMGLEDCLNKMAAMLGGKAAI